MNRLAPFIAIFLFVIGAMNLQAQDLKAITTGIEKKEITVNKWQRNPGKDSLFLWPFSFAEDEAMKDLAFKALTDQYVTRIQLVYTRYAYKKDFNQKALNQLRLQKLFSVHPEWFADSSNIQWEFIEQTGCSNAKDCKDFFHGFAFYYLNKASITDIYRKQIKSPHESEIQDITDAQFLYWFKQTINANGEFAQKADTGSTKRTKPETPAERQVRITQIKETAKAAAQAAKEKKPEPSIAEITQPDTGSASKKVKPVKAELTVSGILNAYVKSKTPQPSTATANNSTSTEQKYITKIAKKRLDNPFLFLNLLGGSPNCECLPDGDCITGPLLCDSCYRRADKAPPFIFEGTVTEVMARFSLLYTNMDIVDDITRGMIPPASELILWANTKRNVTKIRRALFYNDGDMKRDDEKKVGTTGGLYPTDVFNFDSINKATLFKARDRLFATACHALRGGNGGDIPENTIEAVSAALGLCPPCSTHILIADNRSPSRDISLLKQLKYPLRIILPFVIKERGLINTEYLDVARKTHGSVHTKTTDYYNLDKLKDGELLKVLEYKYKLVGEHFICVQVPADIAY